jgi:hypothetical protein
MPLRSADSRMEKWLDTDRDYGEAGRAFAKAAGSQAGTGPDAFVLLPALARANKHRGSSVTTVLPARARR